MGANIVSNGKRRTPGRHAPATPGKLTDIEDQLRTLGAELSPANAASVLTFSLRHAEFEAREVELVEATIAEVIAERLRSRLRDPDKSRLDDFFSWGSCKPQDAAEGIVASLRAVGVAWDDIRRIGTRVGLLAASNTRFRTGEASE